MDEWRQHFLNSSPMFEPLRGVGESLEKLERWPTLDELNALLSPSIRTASGAAIRFVPQDGKPRCMEEKYEARIYLSGEVQTRTENWHDLFNALVWLAFPETKTAINALHFSAISQSASAEAGNRGKTQDVLTLFDESGVVVLYADDEQADLLREHRWTELFWERRQAVTERMKFVIFGHSLYEKALKPYVGFTGKGLMLRVGSSLAAFPGEQAQELDQLIASGLAERVNDALCPVPLLGVPGWWPDNETPAFYQNTEYFRAKKPERVRY
ncbi:hypothetical protein SKTS_18130 [Sulfurimicrobium lacus]|uniref:DUF3025 domain-containing protein n=2 Tax=Sulfurimicrobium lacus TaxID=2715678 RepID=A0A6F8VCU0_9PROT|nr:hypothetical protein SKTS_18130 [Sulfurimicrobium lacus]